MWWPALDSKGPLLSLETEVGQQGQVPADRAVGPDHPGLGELCVRL